MIHCESLTPLLNSSRSVWKATLTTVLSRMTMNRPKITVISTRHLLTSRRSWAAAGAGISPPLLAVRCGHEQCHAVVSTISLRRLHPASTSNDDDGVGRAL